MFYAKKNHKFSVNVALIFESEMSPLILYKNLQIFGHPQRHFCALVKSLQEQ